MKLETEEDFEALNGLRMRHDADGTPIAKCVHKLLRNDYLAFHGRGVLYVYYCRDTDQAARGAKKFWGRRLPKGKRTYDGPQGRIDGFIYFRPLAESEIPKEFFVSKRGGTPAGVKRDPLTGRLTGPNSRPKPRNGP